MAPPRGKKHYKNSSFLAALGKHCKRLRISRGLSIDRLAKESENLSPSVIHRLESGSGAVTVSSLVRLAEVYGLQPKDLLNFDFLPQDADQPTQALILPHDTHASVPKGAYKTLAPLLSLQAAAGGFGTGEHVEPEGWVKVPPQVKIDKQFFVARALGRSMEPKIYSGDLLLFKAHPTGSRQGKIVLAEYRGVSDPETGGAYTVKRYTSEKGQLPGGGVGNRRVSLSPLNKDYQPLVFTAEDAAHVRIIAELVIVL